MNRVVVCDSALVVGCRGGLVQAFVGCIVVTHDGKNGNERRHLSVVLVALLAG